jgi:hypothetical protein
MSAASTVLAALPLIAGDGGPFRSGQPVPLRAVHPAREPAGHAAGKRFADSPMPQIARLTAAATTDWDTTHSVGTSNQE